MNELEDFLSSALCPVCKSTIRADVGYCLSGKRLLQIGCENPSCVNFILKSPRHDTVTAALRSWDARKWDGHHRRETKPKNASPPDCHTLNLFEADGDDRA